MSFGKRFGDLIRKEREERGWSFAQVALDVYGDDGEGGNTRKADVQKLEAGNSRKPNARTVKRYKDGLKLSQEAIDACRTPEEIELAHFSERLFEAISEAVRQTEVPDALASELAERYAEGNPNDFESALNGVLRALRTAAEERAKGALPPNTDDAVSAVMARVSELNDEGRVEDAAALIEDEFARAQASTARLADQGIAQAVLTRDVEAAVRYELRKLEIEVEEAERFEGLRDVRRGW